MTSSARADIAHTPNNAFRSQLEEILGRHFRHRYKIVKLRRRRSPYSSSFAIDELDVYLNNGRHLPLVVKDMSPNAMLDEARRVRPGFLYDPQREISAYQRFLNRKQLGTAIFYGAVADEDAGRYWLFLERVAGFQLPHAVEFHTWRAVAAWLGLFHRRFHDRGQKLREVVDSTLILYQAGFYRSWIARAVRATERLDRSGRLGFRREIDRLAANYDRVVDRLLSLPVTLIHGEFYASNIIIQHETDALRVCPVDWETTGIGPGLVDVAAITGGTWSEPEQLALTEAYQRARTGIATSGPVWRELLESLDYCLLHTAVKNVGWSDDENWTPPPQHAYTWLQDVIRLSRKLGL